ncbi:MAG: DNA polymerase III subunit [Bdellovibrionaceae bacterium]|nr:DNA polymerase III subunit [Bdellovibrio sp.]
MARLIDSVVGHTAVIDQLIQMRTAGRWPHALLFAGPSGVGKRKVALAFAQILICEKEELACGVCGPCLRVAKEQSESLLFVKQDEKAARPTIKVEAVRDLLDSLSLASMGKNRVVIIDDAQTMNPQAANALLKTLEEPFENVFFILIGEDLNQFLPTIRSRVQVIRFAALSLAQIQQVKPGQPDWAYRSSRGQVDRLDLLASPEGTQKREEALGLFEQFCANQDFLLANDWRPQIKDRTWAQFNIICWLQIVRDLVILKTQANKFILNTDQLERLKKLYSIQSKKLLWLAQQLVRAERDLLGNGDPVLIFEDLWVKYARE